MNSLTTNKIVNMKLIYILGFIVICFAPSFAQSNTEAEEFEKQYQYNIKQSRIDGTYIPTDLDDALKEIRNLSPEEGLSSFAQIADEREAARKIHFGLGRWIIVNWNFYDGSRLSHKLKEDGVLHPDDMAHYIIVMLHRELNNKERNPEPIIKELAEERKKIAERLIEKKTKL